MRAMETTTSHLAKGSEENMAGIEPEAGI